VACGLLATIVLAAAADAAGVVIRVMLPVPGLTAAVAVAVPGRPALCAWAALAMPDPPPAAPAGRAAQVITVTGIPVCPVLVVREIALYPGQAAARHSRTPAR
jgi:hypothetical protein